MYRQNKPGEYAVITIICKIFPLSSRASLAGYREELVALSIPLSDTERLEIINAIFNESALIAVGSNMTIRMRFSNDKSGEFCV